MSYKLVIYENFFLNLCGAKVRFFFELCKKNRQLVRFSGHKVWKAGDYSRGNPRALNLC